MYALSRVNRRTAAGRFQGMYVCVCESEYERIEGGFRPIALHCDGIQGSKLKYLCRELRSSSPQPQCSKKNAKEFHYFLFCMSYTTTTLILNRLGPAQNAHRPSLSRTEYHIPFPCCARHIHTVSVCDLRARESRSLPQQSHPGVGIL